MNELGERLERIAETTGPHSAVDAAAAIAKGRRIRRTRRATAIAAAAIVAAAAVPVTLNITEQVHEPTRVVAPPSESAPSPLLERATFGWLPKGYTRTRMYGGAEMGGTFGMTAERGTRGGITLTVFPPGKKPAVPHLPGGRKGSLTEAPPVHGRPADWFIKPGGPGSEQIPAEFRFKYRDDAWAKLQINDRAIADVETVRRIAEGLRFGGTEPARFPLRIADFPEELQVTGAQVSTHPTASFSFRGAQGGTLRLSMNPLPPEDRTQANTTIDGNLAFDSRLPHDGPERTVPASESYIVHVFDERGYRFTLQVRGTALLQRLEKSGGLVGLYRRITLLGPDESKWTTSPFG